MTGWSVPIRDSQFYNLDLSASEVVFTLGVKNAFDEKPPVVYDAANLSYDPKS